MITVALFRNLNLGHPGSPTGDELVDAFGGPAAARSFQSNGTVAFESIDPEKTSAEAILKLRATGYQQPVVIRALEQIRSAVEDVPPVDPGEGVYRSMISFYDVRQLPAVRLPFRSPDGLVEIRALEPEYAHSVCWKPRQTAGNVTGGLEQLLSVPVTTRTLATIQRLLGTISAGIH
jgi:hypothetical protein